MNLHIDSIEKSFGEKKLLQDIFITCNTGEIVGILGRNGSGKSTLMEIIFGTVKAENKFVRVGKIIIKSVIDNRNLIHYLAQDHFLPKHLKIKTIISLFCNKEDAEILKRHHLIINFLNEKPKNLSGGENRLVEILIMLFSDCKFLLLDEPFHSLSPKIIEEIKLLIKQIAKHKGIIITDHQYQNVLEISDRVLLLKDGATKIVNGQQDLRRFGYLN
ncbi:ATP-binding cassette domain-containing protein [Kaistella yonginensis]|uniref:ATP-binding cassette domain-containing protein n=1 Tax=Kaistella yonginensis TaxID=658267 RepID=UPI0025B5A21C|nr:ATP-binding cassette domain-containing protein [Kaistella yonginensis]MDN3605342.1 ATP-binding cassette domain-containing protein [Kaistella yonginensis]